MNVSRVLPRARPRLVAAGLFAAALCASIAPAEAAPSFSLAPSATTVFLNQAFTVGVVANDVTDLFGYQFDVRFDPTLYQVVGVTEGSFLSASGATFYSPGTIDNAAGSVSFVFDTLLGNVAGVSGSGLLGTISLAAAATATGVGSIGLAEVTALDSALDTIALAPAAGVGVSVVPEPEVWTMLLLGTGVLPILRRQSHRSRRPVVRA